MERNRLRQNRIQEALDFFKNKYYQRYSIEITYVTEAALKLTEVYFHIIDNEIKFTVKENVDSGKMASCIELVTVFVKPINSAGEADVYRTNAELAVFLARALYLGFSDIELELESQFSDFNDKFREFVEDHKFWLEMLCRKEKIEQLPVIANGQTWSLIDFIFQMSKHLYYSP